MTANLISADRHFLQQLLLEREELLQQVAQVVEEVDDKQRYAAQGLSNISYTSKKDVRPRMSCAVTRSSHPLATRYLRTSFLAVHACS